jgi:transposase
MARETRSIPFEEFSNNIAGFFERVVRGHETVVVEDERGEVAVLKPAPALAKRAAKRKRTAADREAFLSSLGGWKDLVDTDKLVENIYESRSISTRPPVEL